MESPDNGEILYKVQVDCDPKPTLVDASVQFDLVEDCPSSETEIETTLPNEFSNLDVKFPISVQNCVPVSSVQVSSELLVIANNSSSFLSGQKIPIQTIDTSDTLRKRFCINQDGQTYILSLSENSENLASLVGLSNKSASVENAQLLITPDNVAISSKQGINQNWFTSRSDKTSLRNEGHVWKQGMWSKEEIELLEANIHQYCEERNISNPATIIFDMSKDERKDFYRTVAKGLNRPLFSVYRRVIRMYDNKNHIGKYTPEEISKLKDLRSLHGNNWQSIGSAMGRSASSIKDRCRLMKDHCNQGKWLPAEEKRLAEAVYELANAFPGDMISSGLSWAIVAERVRTRSEKQCRTKWLNYLNWKEAGGTEWTKEDDMTLISSVYASNASDENHIDWLELAKGWLSARSPQWLRGKWWSLKRHVLNCNTIPFPDVCEQLYQQFVLKVQGMPNSPSPVNPEESLSLQTAQVLAKPTFLQAVLPPNSPVVVTNVSQSCPTPIVTPAGSNTIGLESVFSSVRVAPILQTVEVLPSNVQVATNPQTFLSAHAQSSIPLTAALPPNQIIIHTVPTQVIINTVGPMTSLASTQIPSAPPSPEMDPTSLDETHDGMDDEQYDSEVIEIHTEMDDVSEIDEGGSDDTSLCQTVSSPEMILSDPMLAANGSSIRIVKLDCNPER